MHVTVVTRTHAVLFNNASVLMQELGPWCAAAVLLELLRSKQVNNLLDQTGNLPLDNKYTDDGPDAAAIKKTPGAYIPTPTSVTVVDPITGIIEGENLASQGLAKRKEAASQEQQDTEMADVLPVKKPAPVSPEVQALNVALKEVAKMLTQALPISKRRRLASAHGKQLKSVTFTVRL